MINDFLVDFYSEKNNENISQDKINNILEVYGDDVDSLITDLYSKYDPGNIDSDKLNLIKETYGLAEPAEVVEPEPIQAEVVETEKEEFDINSKQGQDYIKKYSKDLKNKYSTSFESIKSDVSLSPEEKKTKYKAELDNYKKDLEEFESAIFEAQKNFDIPVAFAQGWMGTAKGIMQAVKMPAAQGIDLALRLFDPETSKDPSKRAEIMNYHMDKIDDVLMIDEWDDAIRGLDKYRYKPGKGVTETFKEDGFYGAGRKIVAGVFESTPSLVAAATGPIGLTILGTSVVGNTFSEKIKENPEENINRMVLNSTLVGGTEVAFELITRGLLKKAGVIKARDGVEAAKQFIDGGSREILKRYGVDPLTEGGSEALTRLTTDAMDALLDPNVDWDWSKTWRGMVDEGLIGWATGGGIATTGSLKSDNPAVKEASALFLMPIQDKQKIGDLAKQMEGIYNEYQDANDADKKILNERSVTILNEIADIKKKNINNLNSMNESELLEYGANVDKVKNISKQISESDNAENIGYKTTQVKDIQFNNQQILDKARQRAFDKKVNLLKETGNLVLEADDAIRIEDAIKEIERQTGEEVDRSQIETNPANFQFEIYNKDNVNEISEKYNIPVEDLMQESDGSYIAQEGTILMSEEAADGVLEHESGHMYLDIGLSKKENQNLVFSMAEVVKQEIDKVDPEIGKILDAQLERYKKDPRYTAKDVAEEVLTYYLQLKKQGVLGNQDAVNTETSNILKKIYNSLGFGKTKPINLSKDNVIYLLDDYLNSLKNGKLNKQQKEFARGNFKVSPELITGELVEKGKKIAEDVKDYSTAYVQKNDKSGLVEVETETKQDGDIDKVTFKQKTTNKKGEERIQNYKSYNNIDELIDDLNITDEETIEDLKGAAEAGVGLPKVNEVRINNKTGQRAAEVVVGAKFQVTLDATEEAIIRKEAKSFKSDLIPINNLIPETVVTQQDYYSPRVFNPIFNNGNLAPEIVTYITKRTEGNPTLRAEIINSVRERLINFDPQKKRKDGAEVGPKGFGEFIFANVNFGTRTAKKVLAKEAEKKRREVSQEEEFVKDIAAPTETKTEDKKPKPTKRSRIVRDFPEIFDEEFKDEVEIAKFETFEGEIPDPESKDFRGFFTDVSRAKLTKMVKDKLGKGKMYEFNVKKLAPKIKEYYPISWFVRMEGQTKPENRIFTKGPRKLTKQAEINAARLNDKVYVENIAQGVNIYEFKDFTPKQLSDFLLAPAINPNTGKPSGLRGTRKDGLSEGTVDLISADATPSVVQRIPKLKEKVTKIAEKVRREPNAKFAKKGVDELLRTIKTKSGEFLEPLKSINSKGVVTKIKDIEAFEGFMLDIFPQYLPGFLINSGTFANNRRGKNQFLTSKRRSEIQNEVVKNQNLKDLDLTEEELNALRELGKNVNTWWNKIMDIGLRTFNNKKWQEARLKKNKGLKTLWKQFYKMYEDNPENAKYIAAIIQTSSANSGHIMRMAGYPIGFETNWKSDRGPEREHVIPANAIGEFLFKAMVKEIPLDNAIGLVNDNYFQILINKYTDDKIKAAGFQSLMPDGFFESWLDAIEKGTPPQTFLVRYFHPDVNKQIGPDGQAGINPNEMFINIDGETKTVADLNSIGSDVFTSNQLKYPNVISLQQKLLYDIGLNKITKNEAVKTAKRYADKLANQQQNANDETGELINDSGVVFYSKKMDMNSVLSKAATLDNALANARKLDAPVKKIRVFDFDDTLAETKSLVFYNKPSDTKTVKPKLKAIVMAGPPGGGKSSIIKGLGLVKDGFKEVNQDISLEWLKTKEGLPAKEADYTKEQKSMRSKLGAQARKIAARKLDKFAKQGDGIILDGTGASVAATEAKIQALEELGYEVSMIYVNTPKETAIARNRARKERSLPDFVVEKTWDAVDANRNVYAGRFGDKFYEVNTEGLKQGEVPQEVSDAIRNDLAAEERGRLTAEEFAKQGKDLVDQGFVMDFSDFNIIREGERGPLFEVAKKIKEARGNEDLFVLTARAPESQDAIYEFLKSEGLEFKRENIIGLGNSTGAAKANWIVDKAAEGYNDFYFADDAYANVQAVQDALDQIDVKSQVQQAKVKFSKSINEDFNKIIEQTTGIASEKRYSKAKAKVRGAGKGNKKFFIPYSAEDFMGLIYPLLSKGTLGDSQMAWFKEHLLDPYGRAIENLSSDRIQMMQDFKQLKKSLEVPKDLRKKTESGFTNEQAVRVYLFNKVGHDVPGLSETDLKELIDIVNSDGKLKAFADQILSVTKGDGYVKPTQEWLAGTITTDLIDLLNTTKRQKYLEQSGYLDNVNQIFSKENLNKLEAAYGAKYREAMENILARMKSGKNRIFSGSRLSNRVLDYINGSIGTIMFFNTRSAVLQTISAVNFLNWSFNNPYKAGKAFANQKQYWKDFKTLMNSDYLTDRRNGLKLNISENEIANAAATAKNKARGAMNYILQKGYLPTQFADSFAIASGGATFYRNRINDLVNKGMEVEQAEKQALSEWKETAEISQQSSDPSKISQQQASDLGRVILAFANTPMQYARIQKRAIQDLANRRGDAKANVSKLIYYGVVQNLIFNALQQAVFALGFGDDKEDEKKQEKYLDVANGMLDSTLRGLGIAGATIAVIKNFLLDIYERSSRKRPEYVDAVYKLLQISPPISSKISKVRQAAYQFDSKKRRQEIFEKGFSIDNPAYEAGAKVISATTNLPLDRVLNKINNIEAALGEDVETWQRVAMLAGWPEWQIMPKVNKSKDEFVKGFNPSKKDMSDYNVMKKLNKSEQEKILKSKGYSDYEIKRMRKEDDRIKAIMKRNK